MASSKIKKKKKNSYSEKRNRERQNSRQQLIVFTRRFLLAAILLIIPLSLIPEEWYYPLNRITAVMSYEVLQSAGVDSTLNNTFISTGHFKVNVISECSAVHLIALLGAFIYAFPADLKKKLIGFSGGTLFLFVINILRISIVTVIGKNYPGLFEVFHIYFGQFIMMLVTVSCCIIWCRWVSALEGKNGASSFTIRFLIFTSLLFLLWLPLNRYYMVAVDSIVTLFFSLFSHPVNIPLEHRLYYQTFSLITLSGLLFAFKNIKFKSRLIWVIYGFVILTVLQVIFRMSNAWISAFNIQWMRAVSQVVYNIIVYAVPVIFGLRFFIQNRPDKPVSV
jgi:exosortase/archaeosortase family protein